MLEEPVEQPKEEGGRRNSRTTRPSARERRAAGRRGKRDPKQDKPEPSAEEFTAKTRVFFASCRAGDTATAAKLLDQKDVCHAISTYRCNQYQPCIL